MRFKNLVDWRLLAIAMIVCVVTGSASYEWLGFGFWPGFILAAIGMLANGWLAAIEDDQPGGFNNPRTTGKDRDQSRQ